MQWNTNKDLHVRPTQGCHFIHASTMFISQKSQIDMSDLAKYSMT